MGHKIEVVTTEIRIVAGFSKDGEELISCQFKDPNGDMPGYVEVMGLLKWAEMRYAQRAGHVPDTFEVGGEE